MKNIIVTILCCNINSFAFAGDTNFVAQLKTVWQTHNATNILLFTEQNVATNSSPETLFARGITAMALQEWGVGATNFFEQSMHMISTNNTYSNPGKTKAMENIIMINTILPSLIENFDMYSQPTWNTNMHIRIFSELYGEVPFLGGLMDIVALEPAETD